MLSRIARPSAALVLGVCLVAGLGVCTPSAVAQDSLVKLQGAGARREALDALSYQPLDPAVLSSLTSWTGPAISNETIKDKPALLVVWAGWFKPSHAGLTLAQQLADTNPDLVVVGIHHQRGFERAVETAGGLKVRVAIAHDAKGEALKALKADSAGPIFYVVDRAGRLRFADVERASLEAAIKTVVGESASDAGKATKPGAASAGADGAPGTAGGIGGAAGAAGGAGGSAWTKPSSEQYAAAAWPKHSSAGELSAKNVQGKALPVGFGKNEKWITPKVDTTGQVLVLDFWATWCGPCVRASPILDQVQTKHAGKAVVIGVSGQESGARYPEDEKAIRAFIKKKPSEYSHVNDLDQKIYKALSIRGIPHVVIVSTDGVVRWQGNPLSPEFTKAVDAVVKADPGVRAGGGAAEAGGAGGAQPVPARPRGAPPKP